MPLIGAEVEILTANHVSGTFATVNGTKINSSEHFTVTYNSDNVTLTVVSGLSQSRRLFDDETISTSPAINFSPRKGELTYMKTPN